MSKRGSEPRARGFDSFPPSFRSLNLRPAKPGERMGPTWGISSFGRAPLLQGGGDEFESRILHNRYEGPRPV